MSIIDIFVFPSIQEGLPVAVMEAMSMKKPVIATNIRGCRDLILDKKTGILIPVRNPKHIAEAVLHLLKNPKEAAMLGDNARKRIESDFELSTILKQLLSIYRGIT
jgi:glycosyltransferase involved in cell wall biosynthesis